MKIIGLAGPSGAGKGEFCAILTKLGIFSINTDNVYHKLLVPPSACLDELCAHFGFGILKSDGTLDRAALAKIVFAPGNESELNALNKITHFHVLNKVRSIIADFSKFPCPAVIVDAPALFESGFDAECNTVVSVLANKAIRIDRIMQRDGLSYEAAAERINAQKPDEFYIERSDHVFYNNSDLEEFKRQVLAVFAPEVG